MVYTEISFLWDELKNAKNIKKHGLSFEEAQFVFSDSSYILKYDLNNSANEERFKVIGKINYSLLLVVFTESSENKIRIISARHANKSERLIYEKHRK